LQLADAEAFGGNRDFILRYRLAGQTISSGLMLYRCQAVNRESCESFFLLMAEPPQIVTPDEVPPREYVFVVDVSGSMNGFPLDTAKQQMGDLLNVLRPSDTFNIVVFADGFETFSPVSVPATRPNLTRALRFLGRKDGRGGTRLQAALERAVAIPRQPSVSRSIVLALCNRVFTRSSEMPSDAAVSAVLRPSTSRMTNVRRNESGRAATSSSMTCRSSDAAACCSGSGVFVSTRLIMNWSSPSGMGFPRFLRRASASLMAMRVSHVENCAPPANW
jgi:hypothetical protein